MCIPKKIGITTALLTADIGELQKFKHHGEVVDKLAKLIVEWNIEREYCAFRLTGKYENEGNCQDFVEAVMKTLNVSFNPQGPLKHFIEEMRQKGTCDLMYKPSNEVREQMKLEQESYYFESHEELDEFAQKLEAKNFLFKQDFPFDWDLLKSFDRAFWVRNLKEPDNPHYTPSSNVPDGRHEACPFGNPIKAKNW